MSRLHGLLCSQIIDEDETQFMTNCPHAVTESMPRRRTRIQVFWTAPPAGSGCVTFKWVWVLLALQLFYSLNIVPTSLKYEHVCANMQPLWNVIDSHVPTYTCDHCNSGREYGLLGNTKSTVFLIYWKCMTYGAVFVKLTLQFNKWVSLFKKHRFAHSLFFFWMSENLKKGCVYLNWNWNFKWHSLLFVNILGHIVGKGPIVTVMFFFLLFIYYLFLTNDQIFLLSHIQKLTKLAHSFEAVFLKHFIAKIMNTVIMV